MRLECNGFDLLNGVGANRSALVTEHAAIVYGTGQLPASIVGAVHPVVDDSDSLDLVVDNHFAPSAAIQIEIYYALGA